MVPTGPSLVKTVPMGVLAASRALMVVMAAMARMEILGKKAVMVVTAVRVRQALPFRLSARARMAVRVVKLALAATAMGKKQ